MENTDRKKHWDKIYQAKQLCELSWFQPNPKTSLDFLKQFNVSKTAKIIDIGGGDSFLVDNLLDLGYNDITVLDISELAIEKAKNRLGSKSNLVKWVVSDIVNFKPIEKYDFWHDRAAFHFLTEEKEINCYIEIAKENITNDGILVIGTFSDQGPKKCSGIEIKQYSENSITERMKPYFEKINCNTIDHKTPFDTIQNFIFCSFKKV